MLSLQNVLLVTLRETFFDPHFGQETFFSPTSDIFISMMKSFLHFSHV